MAWTRVGQDGCAFNYRRIEVSFPKKIFVKREQSGGETYLVCAEDMVELAEDAGSTIPIAVYELASTAKLATRAEFVADKARAKRS